MKKAVVAINGNKSHCLGLVVLSAVTFTSINPVLANESGFALEEVTVTARKIEENLQNTPISITAISAESLIERDMTSITSIADIAPNVNFSFGGTSSGSGSAAVVYIRGVGQNDFTPVTDPGVGLYVDGVYLGRSIGSVLELLDLKSVEVLRGPQGTLFGRNTIGGAISLSTRNPSDERGGRVRLTVGDDARQEFFGVLDLPFNDQLAASFSALYKQRDGYVDRVLTGADLGNNDVQGARAKIIWMPNEQLNISFSADTVSENEDSAPEVSLGIDPNQGLVGLYNTNISSNGPSNCTDANSTDPLCANSQYVAGPFRSFETGPSINDVDNWGVSLTADLVLDSVILKSITAYRNLDAVFARSSDGTPFTIFQTTDDYIQEQLSQEFQITGLSMNDRLKWVGGLYYFEEQATNDTIVEGVVPIWPLSVGGSTDNESVAIYGEATYDVSERLHVTGGLRYTEEIKRFSPYSILADGTSLIPAGERRQDFDEVTYRATVAYDLADDTMIYVTSSSGFKSGGFHIRNTRADDNPPTFAPEFVDLIEAGIKTEFPDSGVRLNVAAFFSDYEDMQVSSNPPGEVATFTANAAAGEIKGLEVEFAYIPNSKWLIEGALGYQDANYTQLDPSSNVSVTTQDEFIRTPKVSWNLGASYIIDCENGCTVTPRLDWVYKSKIQFEPVNNSLAAQDSYHALNISANYRDGLGEWSVSAGVNNVTDEEYLVAADSNDVIGYALGVYAQPRNAYLSIERIF